MKYLLVLFFLSYSLVGFTQNVKPKMKKKKYGFFIKSKNVIPCVYSEAELIKENYYKVKQENKWGVVDTEKQKEIIPCKYDDIIRKSENGFIALQDGMEGGISNDGETIVDFNFERIRNFEINGEALVLKDGKWGYFENNKINYDIQKTTFTVTEVMPLYGTGCENFNDNYSEKKACAEQEMKEFIYHNIKYPPNAGCIEGTVVIKFIITTTGETKDFEIIRDIGGGCGEEALRVTKLLKNWSPGTLYGVPVNISYNIPVRFKLTK